VAGREAEHVERRLHLSGATNGRIARRYCVNAFDPKHKLSSCVLFDQLLSVQQRWAVRCSNNMGKYSNCL